jgi:hypothetical protein
MLFGPDLCRSEFGPSDLPAIPPNSVKSINSEVSSTQCVIMHPERFKVLGFAALREGLDEAKHRFVPSPSVPRQDEIPACNGTQVTSS